MVADSGCAAFFIWLSRFFLYNSRVDSCDPCAALFVPGEGGVEVAGRRIDGVKSRFRYAEVPEAEVAPPVTPQETFR